MAEKEEGAADAPAIEATEPAPAKSKKPAAKKTKAAPKEPAVEDDGVPEPVSMNTTAAAQGKMNASIGYGDEVRRSTIAGNLKRRAVQHEAMKSAGQNQAP